MAFLAIILDMGTIVAWQVRAQTAADTAAAAEVSVQSFEWNRETALLYAGLVEEYRFRQLFNGVILAANSDGPCYAAGTCQQYFNSLEAALIKSSNRFTKFATVLQKDTQSESFMSQTADAMHLISLMTNPRRCGTPSGLDCHFSYFTSSQGGAYVADSSSVPFVVSQGYTGWNALGGPSSSEQWTVQTNPMNNTASLFGPARAEVSVCHALTLPITLPYIKTINITAHAAFLNTTTALEEIMPGMTINSYSNRLYQPFENYTNMNSSNFNGPTSNPGGIYDWYDPGFGGYYSFYDPSFWIYGVYSTPYEIGPDFFGVIIAWFAPAPAIPVNILPASTSFSGCAS
jgi:hypothetical protein